MLGLRFGLLIVVLSSFGWMGCGSGAVAEANKLVDEICDCPDMECVQNAEGKWKQLGEKLSMDKSAEEVAKLMKKLKPVNERYAKCKKDIAAKAAGTKAGAPAPGAPPGGAHDGHGH